MLMDLKTDWEFNVLQVCNYKASGKLDGYFNFIRQNHNKLNGDICEIGVYRGFSIIATAMLLRDLGSDKKVWGFDSFSGFPSYHENDDLANFESLYSDDNLTNEEYKNKGIYNTCYITRLINSCIFPTRNFFTNNLFKNRIIHC